MYTFVLNDFQSLIMKENTFLQFRRVHKTSSCNLFAFEAKESPVRIFLHKEENKKNPNFIVVIVPID